MLRQTDIRRFLRPAPAPHKGDQEPQERHDEQPTDFSSPEPQAIANAIITQRQLAAPPPNASLCGVPPEKLAHVCDHMPTLEAIRLALLDKTMQDTCCSPFVIRHLIITPATHKLWRRASRAVLRQLRGRLTRLQTAAIATDEEVYSRGPDQDRPGEDTASDDGQQEDDELMQVVGGGTEGRRRALGHRSVYAKMLEGSAASLRKCRLEDKTTSNLPVTASPRPPRVTFGKLEEVVLCDALWQGVAKSRRWSLPALKTLVSSSLFIAPQNLMSWIKASPHLSHVHVTPISLPLLTSSLSAAPSLVNLTSLGCILLKWTDASSWEPLLSVLEAKWAMGANGRIHTLGVCLEMDDMEPDGILTSLRALAAAIQRLAGVGISAADTQVTAIPKVAPWNDHILSDGVNPPHQQVDSVAVPSSSSAAAACEPSVGGGRRAPLFPNMVPTDDHDDDNASGEMADAKPPQRPFRLFVRMPSGFDDRLLRLGLTASDVLPKKIVREMARVAKSMKVKTVSSTAPAGSFDDYVFESLTELTIQDSLLTDGVLPSLPAAPCSRFPRLQSVTFVLPSVHLPPPREAAPALLAQLALECLDTIGHVNEVALVFVPAQLDDIEAFRPQTCPINHLFTTPELAARLPSIKELFITTPYCVHGRFGDVQLDFITAVTHNTPGLKKVAFSERVTEQLASERTHPLRHSPAYLASAAVDGALASAGSPFVVVKTDGTELSLER
ncbi:unnamed protein product [Vitrella brassicaformis CCMP3155]|uniref:Uncharacterized protein n=2 Tax=Vitrella brassicaformis TaxID=1169539 RepID=A0A0G4FYF3_VITBC|nr:unnamed protein product [Vitrella brassicaformis CCMP3155]|eukprot:CEM20461.1 unnamed protein product [Vitrella brassicaformis CCMP3155]